MQKKLIQLYGKLRFGLLVVTLFQGKGHAKGTQGTQADNRQRNDRHIIRSLRDNTGGLSHGCGGLGRGSGHGRSRLLGGGRGRRLRLGLGFALDPQLRAIERVCRAEAQAPGW